MSVNINSGSDDEKGCIASGLALKAMRLAMENKGLLAKAGSMYVGTGETNTINITMEDGTVEQFNVPRTIAVKPPSGLTNGATYGIKLTVDGNDIVTDAELVQISTGSTSK